MVVVCLGYRVQAHYEGVPSSVQAHLMHSNKETGVQQQHATVTQGLGAEGGKALAVATEAPSVASCSQATQ